MQRLIEEMGDLEEIFLDFFELLDFALLLRIPLADFLYLSCLNLQHLVLNLQFFLIVRCVDGPFSSPFAIDVAVLGECHSFLALYHFIILIKSYELPVIAVPVIYSSPAEGTRTAC